MFRWLMPHTNLHELNLDWLIEKIKGQAGEIDALQQSDQSIVNQLGSLGGRVSVLENVGRAPIYYGTPVRRESGGMVYYDVPGTAKDGTWKWPGGDAYWSSFQQASGYWLQVGPDKYYPQTITQEGYGLVGVNISVSFNSTTGLLTFGFPATAPDYAGQTFIFTYQGGEPAMQESFYISDLVTDDVPDNVTAHMITYTVPQDGIYLVGGRTSYPSEHNTDINGGYAANVVQWLIAYASILQYDPDDVGIESWIQQAPRMCRGRNDIMALAAAHEGDTFDLCMAVLRAYTEVDNVPITRHDEVGQAQMWVIRLCDLPVEN